MDIQPVRLGKTLVIVQQRAAFKDCYGCRARMACRLYRPRHLTISCVRAFDGHEWTPKANDGQAQGYEAFGVLLSVGAVWGHLGWVGVTGQGTLKRKKTLSPPVCSARTHNTEHTERNITKGSTTLSMTHTFQNMWWQLWVCMNSVSKHFAWYDVRTSHKGLAK